MASNAHMSAIARTWPRCCRSPLAFFASSATFLISSRIDSLKIFPNVATKSASTTAGGGGHVLGCQGRNVPGLASVPTIAPVRGGTIKDGDPVVMLFFLYFMRFPLRFRHVVNGAEGLEEFFGTRRHVSFRGLDW